MTLYSKLKSHFVKNNIINVNDVKTEIKLIDLSMFYFYQRNCLILLKKYHYTRSKQYAKFIVSV